MKLHVGLATLLLSFVCSNFVNAEDKKHNIPTDLTKKLQTAANNGDAKQLGALLKQLASDEERSSWIGIATDEGATVLHYAASKGQIDLVKLLLEQEKDLLQRVALICKPMTKGRYQGMTAFDLALAREHGEIARLLSTAIQEIDVEDHTTALHYAARDGDFDLVQHLLNTIEDSEEKIAFITTKSNPLKESAAMWAFMNGHREIEIWLTAEVNRLTLHCAARDGNSARVTALLESIKDPAQKLALLTAGNCLGENAYILAVMNKHFEVADIVDEARRALAERQV